MNKIQVQRKRKQAAWNNLKNFDFLDKTNVHLLFKVMMQSVLEYCKIALGSHYKTDQKKIEQVQRRATRLVPSLRHLTYQERLEKLDMPNLSYRRRRGNMIAVFKIMTCRASGIHFFTAQKVRVKQEDIISI